MQQVQKAAQASGVAGFAAGRRARSHSAEQIPRGDASRSSLVGAPAV